MSIIKLPRTTPEEQGVSSYRLQKFLNRLKEINIELHTFMILRNGSVIAEAYRQPYSPEYRRLLHSLSKSFTSTAIGIAIDEGILAIDDKVALFFPNELPEKQDEKLLEMTVFNLLTMTTGHKEDTLGALISSGERTWIEAFLACPLDYKPGTQFVYNSGATFMLSAIIQKITGLTLFEYLQPRVFEPLGIQGAQWDQSPCGVNTGGWGLMVKPEDIAKFGQMYLQEGVFSGKRIVSKKWVQQASSKSVSNDTGVNPDIEWNQGYGFQFWMCRHDAYRADGAFGQYCVVMPKQNMVFVATCEENCTQNLLDILWEELIADTTNQALLSNCNDFCELQQKLDGFEKIKNISSRHSYLEKIIHNRSFISKELMSGIHEIKFHFERNRLTVHIEGEGTQKFESSCTDWVYGEMDNIIVPPVFIQWFQLQNEKTLYACQHTWLNDNILEITLKYLESAHQYKIICVFENGNIHITFVPSYAKYLLSAPDSMGLLKNEFTFNGVMSNSVL
ncbi:MAG TPA: serine hydrolase [Epulopiscium sp.]|nr:serine hydrolase [Candidatus Epulonipiscium sp.]